MFPLFVRSLRKAIQTEMFGMYHAKHVWYLGEMELTMMTKLMNMPNYDLNRFQFHSERT